MNERTWLLKEKYLGIKSPEFFSDLKRIESGEPLAYVIGSIPFLGTSIDLSSRPLIPRPETEWWTELLIDDLRSDIGARHCLDLCAGSGAIGIALLYHLPTVTVDFGEIEPRHIDTIRSNIIRNGIDPTRTRIIETDIWSAIDAPYDRIAANPPYIPNGRALDPSVMYEPEKALFGGEIGTEIISRIVLGAKEHLLPGGKLYLEFDPGQEEQIQKDGDRGGLSVTFHDDQYGHPRLAVLQ